MSEDTDARYEHPPQFYGIEAEGSGHIEESDEGLPDLGGDEYPDLDIPFSTNE